jgi:hypothetical protein
MSEKYEQLELPFDGSKPTSKPKPVVEKLNGCWSALSTKLSNDLLECEYCKARFTSPTEYWQHLKLPPEV